jgi:hypothetical protein
MHHCPELINDRQGCFDPLILEERNMSFYLVDIHISWPSQLRCLCIRCLPQFPRPDGPPCTTDAFSSKFLTDPPPDLNHLVKINGPLPVLRPNDTVLGIFERVQHVLGSNVACRTGRIRTSAEPADGGVNGPDALREGRKDVGNCCPEGVVELEYH